MLFSTGATTVFILGNSLLLFSEIVQLTMINDLQLFANIIGVICMHLAGLIKWCYCIKENHQIIDIVIKLEKCHVLCQQIDNSEEGCRIYRNKMECAHRYSSYFIYGWACACTYGVLHWCINPFLLGTWALKQMNSTNHTFIKRSLPFIGWYPLNTDDIYNYIYLYVIQVIGGISSAFGIICYDTFYVTMLMIICVQFQHINTILQRNNFDKYDQSLFLSQVICKINSLDHGKILLDLQRARSNVYSREKVKELRGLSCRDYKIHMESIFKLWTLLVYFLCASVQLYVFCFFATQLGHLGLQIAHSVYFCGWELMIFKERKDQSKNNFGKQLKHCNIDRLVQTIMVRAQRPIILTGGPFYVLSLETFRVVSNILYMANFRHSSTDIILFYF
ncbi:putative odorant receptor 85d isoform X2 [Formica exsecta]|uniref:putative odorant receptor 85d isoform X2 n=1 Tax=Formica exsecta TaxID=72781 RepID=UPI001144174E|nr:putative odorant receptor 85d isoform X2 [Formica exsecta]